MTPEEKALREENARLRWIVDAFRAVLPSMPSVGSIDLSGKKKFTKKQIVERAAKCNADLVKWSEEWQRRIDHSRSTNVHAAATPAQSKDSLPATNGS